jgi:hypothetical protein
VSPDPFEAPGIYATARLLGAYAWLEGRLFEVLGELAARGGDLAEAAVWLDGQSQQHAWHASLFSEKVPTLPDLDPPSLMSAPSAAAEALLDALAGVISGCDALALSTRLVLPRLVTGYRRHLRRTRAASDGAVARALRLVVRDEVDALVEAEAMLEELLAEGRLFDAELLRSVETRLAPAGPGLVPWPARAEEAP